MSTMSRTNRPGPRRRCSPCPACGDDAMRQYGAKHHGIVSRYFYACQTCQHTDVWREVFEGGPPRWEKLRTPLVPPRPEQCRLELREDAAGSGAKTAQKSPFVSNNFSLAKKEKNVDEKYLEIYSSKSRTCTTCARFLEDERTCIVPEDWLQEVARKAGMVLAAGPLPIQADKVRDCAHWVSDEESDRHRLLRHSLRAGSAFAD